MDPIIILNNTYLPIPEGAFFTTWGKIRLLAAICFIFGWFAKSLNDYLLEKIKAKKEARACQT